jgi:hypothetical protein
MNENKQKLKKYFSTYITIVISMTILLIVLIFIPLIPDVKWSIFLVVFVFLFVISLYFRPRIEYYSAQSRLDQLISTSNAPIASPIEVASDPWITNIQQMGFILNKEFKDYYLAHRIHSDASSIVTKRGILEVIVYVRNQDILYTDERFNRVIRQIEEEYSKTKTRYHHYTILIIKSGDVMTEETKKQVDEVYFNKSNHRFITIIHAYAIKKTKQLYFLHSDTDSPNLFYREASFVLLETIGIKRS